MPVVALAEAALAAGRLRLALQPVRPAARPDLLAFEEALARVEGPEGPLSAALFVPALEAEGRAPALDRAALSAALALLARRPATRLSVNLSAATLGDAAWFATLEAAPARDARRLIVELTETRPADPALACMARARIAATGAAFALDDYGAGHADAVAARALRPDVLKLDAGLPGSRLPEALALAAELDAMTVAEGVTSPAQAAALARAGVDAVQGRWSGGPALAA